MSQNEWTGPGVRDLGDEIEVEVSDVRERHCSWPGLSKGCPKTS